MLTRRPQPHVNGVRQVYWDGANLDEWAVELEGVQALINLAGRSVNCRYHRRHREQILNSRLDSTCVLGRAVQQCRQPPKVWLNFSTATIYKHTYGVIAWRRRRD